MIEMTAAGAQGQVYVPPQWRALPPAQQASRLAAAEAERSRAAELFWVSADMTDVAIRAGRALPAYGLAEYDLPSTSAELELPSTSAELELPSTSGLMVWDKSIAWLEGEVEQEDVTQQVTGSFPVQVAVWGRWTGPSGDPLVWVSCWSPHGNAEETLIQEAARDGGHKGSEQARRMLGPGIAFSTPLLMPFSGEVTWPSVDPEPFGAALADLGLEPENNAVRTHVARVQEPMMRTVLATWLLMAQPLAAETRLEPQPKVRRSLARTPTPAADVRIITLRRREEHRERRAGHEDAAPESPRVYRHRWDVVDHWHKYWVGPRDNPRLERRFVLSYEKGPEGAPKRERVHVLRR